ncbi:hypothetical protein ScPMuIL_005746 [Solemya velum]
MFGVISLKVCQSNPLHFTSDFLQEATLDQHNEMELVQIKLEEATQNVSLVKILCAQRLDDDRAVLLLETEYLYFENFFWNTNDSKRLRQQSSNLTEILNFTRNHLSRTLAFLGIVQMEEDDRHLVETINTVYYKVRDVIASCLLLAGQSPTDSKIPDIVPNALINKQNSLTSRHLRDYIIISTSQKIISDIRDIWRELGDEKNNSES